MSRVPHSSQRYRDPGPRRPVLARWGGVSGFGCGADTLAIAPVSPKNRTLGFASCALASSLWGCGFFFGKIALVEMGVGAMVLYRFLFATLVLLPLLFTHRPSFDRREWGTLLFCAFLGIPLQFLIQDRAATEAWSFRGTPSSPGGPCSTMSPSGSRSAECRGSRPSNRPASGSIS